MKKDNKYSYSIDPKPFWEKKILNWENSRYGEASTESSLLEKLANHASNSVQNRLYAARNYLAPAVKDKHIVELGCGSGLLAIELIKLGAASYTGYDISENAINNARLLIQKANLESRINLKIGAIEDLSELNTDIVFSLGLLDWLTDEDLKKVFEIGKNAHFLHAISEKRFSLEQFLHRLYVHLSYGWKTGGYVPRYHTVNEIKRIALPDEQPQIFIRRQKRLSFSTFITTIEPDASD